MGCHISDGNRVRRGTSLKHAERMNEKALKAAFAYLDTKNVIYLMLLSKRVGTIIQSDLSWCESLKVDNEWAHCKEIQLTKWFKSFKNVKNFTFRNFEDGRDVFIISRNGVQEARRRQEELLNMSSFLPKHFTELFLASSKTLKSIHMQLDAYSRHSSWHVAATDDCIYNQMVDAKYKEKSPPLHDYTPYLFPIICRNLSYFSIQFNPYNSFSDIFCLIYSFCLPNLDVLELTFSSPPILDELEYQNEARQYDELDLFSKSDMQDEELSLSDDLESNSTPLVSAPDFFNYILNPMDTHKLSVRCLRLYFTCPSLLHVGLISQFLRPVVACMHRLIEIRQAQIRSLKKALKRQEIVRPQSFTHDNHDSLDNVITAAPRQDTEAPDLFHSLETKAHLIDNGNTVVDVNSPEYTDTLLSLRELNFDLLLLGNVFLQAIKLFWVIQEDCADLWPNIRFNIRNFLCAPSWVSGNEPVEMADLLLNVIRGIGRWIQNEAYIRLSWLSPRRMSDKEVRQLKSLKLKCLDSYKLRLARTSSADSGASKRSYFRGFTVERKFSSVEYQDAFLDADNNASFTECKYDAVTSQDALMKTEEQAQVMLFEWLQKHWNPEKVQESLQEEINLGNVKVLYITYLDISIDCHTQFLKKVVVNNPYQLRLRLKLVNDHNLRHLDKLSIVLKGNLALNSCQELWIQTNLFRLHPQEQPYYANLFEFCCSRAKITFKKWDQFNEAQMNK